jgi:hypothetical protein
MISKVLDKPLTFQAAYLNPGWLEAILRESDSLKGNHTWTIVDRPNGIARTSCYKLNSAWLMRPEVKTEITKLWKAFPDGTHFLVKFRRVIKFYRTYCKEQAEA